ncbi:MAG: YraN family protein [Beijerinckiaceae bacterium]
MKPARDADARRHALRSGARAEYVAAAFLMLKGYRPLSLRYAAHGGEIDLIVKRGKTIAFIEVKARADLDAALEAIGAAKIERFRRAADAWIMRHGWAADHTVRADAVLIAPRTLPRHVENVFPL